MLKINQNLKIRLVVISIWIIALFLYMFILLDYQIAINICLILFFIIFGYATFYLK
jgi:hypothetical protein